MSLRINHNSASIAAQRNLAASDSAMSKSIERLSSGYKINSAADDPAGLVISEKLRAQVSGLGQAISNASDAVNMIKTAEGALTEVNSLLRSMRDLAVHAANTGATDTASVAADQQQIASAIDSINKIASETQFGNKKLLDGSAGIMATIKGSAVVSANLSNASLTADVSDVAVNMTTGVGVQAATKASVTGSANVSGGNASGGDWNVSINGVGVTFTDGMTQAQMVDTINNVTNQTGVVASVSGNFIKLDQSAYGSTARIDVTGANATNVFGAASLAAVGNDAKAVVTSGGTDVTDALWDKGTGTLLKDSHGNTIQLTDAAASAGADNAAQFDVKVGTLTFQVGAYAGQTRSVSISSIDTSNLGLGNGTSVTSVADINVSTDAQSAIKVLDKAISDVSSQRAVLGATQKNTLESSINSLTIAKENISASESTIRDTDMASEMAEFTKSQILNQAGISMLSQANQAPQQLLSLLR